MLNLLRGDLSMTFEHADGTPFDYSDNKASVYYYLRSFIFYQSKTLLYMLLYLKNNNIIKV